MRLATPLTPALLRTTETFIEALASMGIATVGDMLLYLPRDHEDLSSMATLTKAPLNEKVTLRGTIDKLKLVRTRGGRKFVQAIFIDEEGETAQVIWFNQPHVLRMLKDGQETVLTGKIVENGFKLQMQSPTFERAGAGTPLHGGKIVPVYPQHDIVSTRWLREKMPLLRGALSSLRDTLPEEVVREENLLSRSEAVGQLHFPSDAESLGRARDRFAFEELFQLQLQALERKREWQREAQARLRIPMDAALIKSFFSSLSFTPTDGQRVAIYEILKDMEQDKPMSRLLEGDVGSGKTLVAVAVMANVVYHGGQCALMVPTEVLARQHAEGIARLFLLFHKNVPGFRLPATALLTGSTPKDEAKSIRMRLATGAVDIIVGTHALIEEGVTFRDLKLAIVDEQHRFGVLQRARLKEKGSPHFLAMTATPIPRTLALTAYGDHDISVLLEKPGNRKPIVTKVVPPDERRTIEHFIDREIETGRQVFVICPLISESSSDDMAEVKSVRAEEKRLKESFPRRRIAVLHGKMPPKEKEATMRAFKNRESDILVSTSVIEVGIDVPNATIMVIEGAERFGLAQLHQFRGRVGRGEHQSRCFLFTTLAAQARSQRLKAMEQHASGFKLAEIDLQLRGPGELFGLRQSGIAELRFGSLLDPALVVRARRAAERALAALPA